jgi:glycosyltransferase involved in cell wall biosynthesis
MRVVGLSQSMQLAWSESRRVVPRDTATPALGLDAAVIKILSFTTLYPSPADPTRGVFVENRLRRLAETRKVDVTVVAPVPWFPVGWKRFGQYAAYARVPRLEVRHDIEVFHPRYPTIPKGVALRLAPVVLYRAARRLVRRLVRERGIDLIDAHVFHPDGVAGVRLGKEFARPVCVTGRGTDLNLHATFPGPRRQIEWAARRAAALITVCDALQQPLLDMGIDAAKITTLRNGVDLDLFRPLDRDHARRRWAAAGRVIISVGWLIERKGHHLIIDAMKSLPNTTLLIAGTGPWRGSLERQIAATGLSERVRLLGGVAHEDLPSLYSAADALVLASSREGWANVLLEAMACGTPVVATDFWGTGEVVRDPAAGVLIKERSTGALADGVRALFARLPAREATRAYAERFSWNATTEGQLELFQRLTGY